MAENYKQQAAAQLAIALGHIDATLQLWSPGIGLSPREEQEDSECKSWKKLADMFGALSVFAAEEGPGA